MKLFVLTYSIPGVAEQKVEEFRAKNYYAAMQAADIFLRSVHGTLCTFNKGYRLSDYSQPETMLKAA